MTSIVMRLDREQNHCHNKKQGHFQILITNQIWFIWIWKK